MPYVDAFFDRDSDIIRVVERKDGKDISMNINQSTHFIMRIHVANTKASTATL